MISSRGTNRQPAARTLARAQEAAAAVQDLILHAENAAFSLRAGRHARKKTGSGENFWQFRSYAPSDSVSRIDWRQSAKTDQPFIREKEWQAAHIIRFLYARDAGMDYASSSSLFSKHDSAAILALALGLIYLRDGNDIGLGHDPRKGRSRDVIDFMAAHLGEAPERFFEHLKAEKNAFLIHIGDFLHPLDFIQRRLEAAAAFSRHGLVLQILDPAEIDFPFSEQCLFVSPDGSLSHHIADPAAVARDYSARLQTHLSALRALCARYGFTYVLHRTDRPFHETLRAIYEELNI